MIGLVVGLAILALVAIIAVLLSKKGVAKKADSPPTTNEQIPIAKKKKSHSELSEEAVREILATEKSALVESDGWKKINVEGGSRQWQKSVSSGLPFLVSQFSTSASVQTVSALVKSAETAKAFNSFWKRREIIEKISESTQIYYEEFGPVFGHGSWDVSVLEHSTTLDDGTTIIVKKSVEDSPKIAPKNSPATVQCSGWIIRRRGEETEVTSVHSVILPTLPNIISNEIAAEFFKSQFAVLNQIPRAPAAASVEAEIATPKYEQLVEFGAREIRKLLQETRAKTFEVGREKGVDVSRKPLGENGRIYLRVDSQALPSLPEKIADFLWQYKEWPSLDKTLKRVKVITEIGQHFRILNLVFESKKCSLGPRDACVLTHRWYDEKSLSHVQLMISTEHPDCPPVPSHTRTQVGLSGWIVTPTEDGLSATVTFISQTTIQPQPTPGELMAFTRRTALSLHKLRKILIKETSN